MFGAADTAAAGTGGVRNQPAAMPDPSRMRMQQPGSADSAESTAASASSIAQSAGSTAATASSSSDSSNGSSSSSSSNNIVNVASSTIPKGLLDECVDVFDQQSSSAGMVQGVLSTGSPPSRRICSSTTFVYPMRYGPFTACGNSSRAVNTAALTTADTRVRTEDRTEIPVEVFGCSPALLVKDFCAQAYGDPSYSWSVSTRAEASALRLPLHTAGNNTYNVSYERHLEVSNPRLNVRFELHNPGSNPMAGAHATYVVNTTCGRNDTATITVGSFACNSGNEIQGLKKAQCAFEVSLQCAAEGTVAMLLLTSTGRVVAAGPMAFTAPAVTEDGIISEAVQGACVEVSCPAAAARMIS
jgi:hypothetical protein